MRGISFLVRTVIVRYRGFLVVGLFFLVSFAALLDARSQIDKNTQIVSDMKNYPVEAPSTIPALSQESIDIALEIFNIRVPASAKHPVLNVNLEDRGISSRQAWSELIVVEIGPSSFLSWGLLASTLAHELEIHCTQNFTLINMMDQIGLNGTINAERDAYQHELKNAKRFGLDEDQQRLIQDTMDYYYATDQMDQSVGLASRKLRDTLSSWLAKSFRSND